MFQKWNFQNKLHFSYINDDRLTFHTHFIDFGGGGVHRRNHMKTTKKQNFKKQKKNETDKKHIAKQMNIARK